jgi:hypothetical protein
LTHLTHREPIEATYQTMRNISTAETIGETMRTSELSLIEDTALTRVTTEIRAEIVETETAIVETTAATTEMRVEIAETATVIVKTPVVTTEKVAESETVVPMRTETAEVVPITVGTVALMRATTGRGEIPLIATEETPMTATAAPAARETTVRLVVQTETAIADVITKVIAVMETTGTEAENSLVSGTRITNVGTTTTTATTAQPTNKAITVPTVNLGATRSHKVDKERVKSHLMMILAIPNTPASPVEETDTWHVTAKTNVPISRTGTTELMTTNPKSLNRSPKGTAATAAREADQPALQKTSRNPLTRNRG